MEADQMVVDFINKHAVHGLLIGAGLFILVAVWRWVVKPVFIGVLNSPRLTADNQCPVHLEGLCVRIDGLMEDLKQDERGAIRQEFGLCPYRREGKCPVLTEETVKLVERRVAAAKDKRR